MKWLNKITCWLCSLLPRPKTTKEMIDALIVELENGTITEQEVAKFLKQRTK